jgi:hypothetical protein
MFAVTTLKQALWKQVPWFNHLMCKCLYSINRYAQSAQQKRRGGRVWEGNNGGTFLKEVCCSGMEKVKEKQQDYLQWNVDERSEDGE